MPQAYVCLVLFASPNIWKGESGLDPFYRRRMISPEPTMQRISEGDKQDTGNLGVVIENDTPLCRHVLFVLTRPPRLEYGTGRYVWHEVGPVLPCGAAPTLGRGFTRIEGMRLTGRRGSLAFAL
jgi:hypothetical protein